MNTTATERALVAACGVLEWDGTCSGVADDLLSRSMERVCKALCTRLGVAAARQVPGAREAAATLPALTTSQLLRITSAPATFATLSRTSGDDDQILIAFFRRS